MTLKSRLSHFISVLSLTLGSLTFGSLTLGTLACTHGDLRGPAASSEPVFESDFISSPGSFPSLHGSTLTELPSLNQILACWYAGEREMGKDVQIYCSRSPLDQTQWSTPTVAVAAQEKHTGDLLNSKSIGNPVLFHDAETKLTYLFFGTVTVGGWRGVRTFLRISKDFGATWSASMMVTGGFPGDSNMLGRVGKFVRIKPILLSPDQFLLPMYSEWDEKRSFACLFKRVAGVFKEDRCSVMPGHQSLQPSLVIFKDSVRAYTRSKNGSVQMAQMDRGSFEWTALENLAIPNPDSSIDTIASFDGEKLYLVGNVIPAGRSSLDLMVSTDGKEFRKLTSFEHSENGAAEFSYPALIKTSDGFYHLSFTNLRTGIKHIKFNDAWINK